MREEGSESYWVREDVDFEVGLYDGHFDVERCNFVCQALLGVREFIRLGKQATELWSSWGHGHIHHRILPEPSQRRNIRLGLGCPNGQLGGGISVEPYDYVFV